MTSQDDLALLKQMYQRGEITDGQYDVLRRHVLWGTPLPQLMDDIPAPRSEPAPRRAPDPPAPRVGSPLDPAGYVAGSSTVGPRPGGYPAADPAGYGGGEPSGVDRPGRYAEPDRSRAGPAYPAPEPAASPPPAPDRSGPAPFPPPGAYPEVGDARYPPGRPEPGRPAPTPPDPGDRYSAEPGGGRYPAESESSPAGAPEPGRRRYASRRERREAEEADYSPSSYLPPAAYYPAPADGYPAPADGYPGPADGYPGPADGYPGPADGYPGPADGYPGPADGYPAPADGFAAPADGYPAPAGGPVRPRRSRRHRRDDPDEPDGTPALRDSPPPRQDDLGEYAPSAYRTPVDERWQAAPIAYDPTAYPRSRHQDDPPDDELTGRRARRAAEAGSTTEREPRTRRGRRTSDPDAPAEPDPLAHPRDERERDADRRGSGRRPHRRSLLAVLTSLALALALAAGGVYWFVLRTSGVPPTTYAREACGSVRDWQQAVDSSNTTLVNGIARQQDGAKIRAAVTAYYTTVAGRTEQLRTAILGLGVADIAGGQQYGDSLAAAVGDQATALRTLAARAGRLDPTAATFEAQLHDLLTGADSAVSAVSGALARPAAGISTELRTTLSDEPACAPYVG